MRRSEIYESVPPGCETFGGSLGDDLDEPLSPSLTGVYGPEDIYQGARQAHYGHGGGTGHFGTRVWVEVTFGVWRQ